MSVVRVECAPDLRPADQLFPVGGQSSGPDRTVVDLTFRGDSANRPVISQLARTCNVDVSILGAAVQTCDGRQIGRMRIELPGCFEDNVVPIGFLREQAIQVDTADTAADVQPRPAPSSA